MYTVQYYNLSVCYTQYSLKYWYGFHSVHCSFKTLSQTAPFGTLFILIICDFKKTIPRDFLPPFFLLDSNPSEVLNHVLKYLLHMVLISQRYSIVQKTASIVIISGRFYRDNQIKNIKGNIPTLEITNLEWKRWVFLLHCVNDTAESKIGALDSKNVREIKAIYENTST